MSMRSLPTLYHLSLGLEGKIDICRYNLSKVNLKMELEHLIWDFLVCKHVVIMSPHSIDVNLVASSTRENLVEKFVRGISVVDWMSRVH
jgi:hypothetical protein